MIRRAIIIGAPGNQYAENYLHGVEADLSNYINFLQSPTGGAWMENEMIIINDPDRDRLKVTVQKLEADYLLFIFSGHGAYWIEGGTLLAINRSQSVRLVDLISPHIRKQLFIIDACRSFVSSGIAGFDGVEIGDPAKFKRFPSSLTKQEARNLFVQYLGNCPEGVMLCYSSSPGQVSYDTEEGGHFTTALLNATNNWVNYSNDASVLPIEHAFTNAKSYIFRNLTKDQTPVLNILKRRPTYGFPFAFKRPYSPLG